MTNIKFKHGEETAEIDKGIFKAWECKLISASDAIHRMTENNDLPRLIKHSDFVDAAKELGYKRGRDDWTYEEDEED